MEHKFKEGDEVRCISTTPIGYEIVQGKIYTIKECYVGGITNDCVRVTGIDRGFFASQFELYCAPQDNEFLKVMRENKRMIDYE
jgi:DUF917 family protein